MDNREWEGGTLMVYLGRICIGLTLLSALAAGQENWIRQSPPPALNAVAFADADYGLAVGSSILEPFTDWRSDPHAAILQTTDGGAHWRTKVIPTDGSLNDVLFVDATTALAVGAGTILMTTDRGDSWTEVPSGTNQNLYRIHFFDRMNGIIVGEAVTLHTSDGGLSWRLESDGTTNRLNAVAFSDTTHGIVVGNRGTIMQTSDGGLHWQLLPAPLDADLRSVASPDSQHALALGVTLYNDYYDDRSYLLRRTGGTDRWSVQCAPFGVALADVGTGDITTYFAVGDNAVLRTTDAGATWHDQANGTTHTITDVALLDTSRIIVAGDDGLRRSTDGGRTWKRIELEPISRFGGYRVAFDDRGTGIAMRRNSSLTNSRTWTWESTIFRWRSTDRGDSWHQLPELPWLSVQELSFQRACGAYAAIFESPNADSSWAETTITLAQSTDAGVSWVPMISHEDTWLTSLVIPSAGRAAYVRRGWDSVGGYSAIHMTADSGNTWRERYRSRDAGLVHLSFFDSTTAVAIGSVGSDWDPNQTLVVIRTTDTGESWTRLSLTAKGTLSKVALTSTTGLAIGSVDPGTGRVPIIYRTTDAGLTWSPLSSPTKSPLTSVTLMPDGSGAIVGTNGDVWLTFDRGTTWHNRSGSIRGDFRQVRFFDAQNGYVAGSGVNDIGEAINLALFTTDGGHTWSRRTLGISGEFGGISLADFDSGVTSRWNAASGKTEILITRDGGVTWSRRYEISRHSISSVHAYITGSTFIVSAAGRVDSSGASYLVSSTDGGLTWAYALVPGPDYQNYSVSHLPSGNALVIGDRGSILSSSDRGSTWSDLTGTVRVHLKDVHFADRQNGIAVGAGSTSWGGLGGRVPQLSGARVLLTTDGGHSWEPSYTSEDGPLSGIWQTSPSTAFAVGSGDSSRMLRSDDGGRVWTPVHVDNVDVLNQVMFVSPLDGIAVGGQGDRSVYLVTTDGGATWTDRKIGWFGRLTRLATFDGKPIAVVGSNANWNGAQGIILASTDAGVTWIGRNGTLNTLNAVAFSDVLHGVAVGVHGTIVHTIDGGEQWTTVASGTACHLHAIRFTDASSVVAVGDSGTIVRSTNGGASWSLVASGIRHRLRGLRFYDTQNGVTVGDSGTVLRTTDQGATWSALPCPTSLDLRDVAWIGEDRIIGVGGRHVSRDPWRDVPGYVRTEDGGAHWTVDMVDSIDGHFLAIQFLSSSTGCVLHSGGLRWTTDSGTTWMRTTPVEGWTSWAVHSIEVLDDSTIIAVGQTGDGHFSPIEALVIRSTDRGSTWRPLSSFGGTGWGDPNLLNDVRPLLAVDFPTRTTGTIVGSNGVIYRTTNGGTTWVGAGMATEATPRETRLEQNYPNPFNAETKVGFRMKERGWVKVSVFDILGREVAVLVNEEMAPGLHTIPWNAHSVPSGVYFYRLTAPGVVETKKMILVR